MSNYRPHTQLRKSATALAYLLSVHILALLFFFLFRLAFFFTAGYEFPPDVRQEYLLQARSFLYGLWFDNVIACYLLLVPLALCAGLVAVSVEGWFTEGAARNSNGTMAVCYTRLFSRHQLCVFSPNISLSSVQTPFSEAVGRCTLTIYLPCRRRIRVRSIKKLAADHLRLVA